MQSAASIERQLPHNTTIAVTYTNSHGVHMLRSADINAPLPGTYQPNVPGSGVFPLGAPGPVFLMESSGLYNQNQLITNVNSRLNQNISLFGFYIFNHARSNTDGLGTFPANPYNFAGEYGPASTDIHHRLFIGGSVNTKWNVRLSPFVVVQSGPPFDITAGRDLYGTTLFNGRPGIATDPNKPGVIQTPYGLLDPNPTPDEKAFAAQFRTRARLGLSQHALEQDVRLRSGARRIGRFRRRPGWWWTWRRRRTSRRRWQPLWRGRRLPERFRPPLDQPPLQPDCLDFSAQSAEPQ